MWACRTRAEEAEEETRGDVDGAAGDCGRGDAMEIEPTVVKTEMEPTVVKTEPPEAEDPSEPQRKGAERNGGPTARIIRANRPRRSSARTICAL